MGAHRGKPLPTKKVLAFLRANKLYLKKEFGVTQIALFGSYARGEQTSASDIDVLIEMKVHNFRKRLHIQDFLQKNLRKDVDVLYFSAVRKYIMQQIEKDIIYA